MVLIGIGVAEGVGVGNAFAAGFNRIVAEHGLERGFVGPCGRIDGLTVIVCIENNGMRSVFGVEFAENDRTAPFNRKQMRFDAAGFQHFLEVRGIFFDIGRVAGDVGDGEKFAQFADDAVFVGEAISAHFFGDVLRGRQLTFCDHVAADRGLRERQAGA